MMGIVLKILSSILSIVFMILAIVYASYGDKMSATYMMTWAVFTRLGGVAA